MGSNSIKKEWDPNIGAQILSCNGKQSGIVIENGKSSESTYGKFLVVQLSPLIYANV